MIISVTDMYNYNRRKSTECHVGDVIIGGENPIRVQSMTNTNTNDVEASVAQIERIVDAGADIVRLTAQGKKEALALKEIETGIHRDGYKVPLVADIHFNAAVADVAAEIVEKVRINPGNYVDPGRTFVKLEYTDEEYEMLCYVLQGEVGDCSEASKIAVANVIINRVKSSQFPDSISAVLTVPSQFDAIYGYYNGTTVPTQNTRECAARALAGEDNTGGATYYYAPGYCGGSTASWFETLQFCYEVDGQRYFKNW